ncbi:MAG: pseudouridine synthase, partial [Terracidiphilus sp.]
MAKKQKPKPTAADLPSAPETVIEDPIGDVIDGEGRVSTAAAAEAEIAAAEDNALPEAEIDAELTAEGEPETPESEAPEREALAEIAQDEAASDKEAELQDTEPEFESKPRPPAKLERLQKILAAAGVASRRKAEEMIEQGRVQVNGKVVTEPGTKADAGRDHIRVDGKLLQGAERHRYFVLNKPRGFVTTVKDPEGRPTVMQFFDKMRERLYPVGRLDYMSEGLLLVTNDGELANRLTKASAGVEKTYLVKVAGIPTEGELDILRAGVAIEKGKPGSDKVRTSPARIRQVRQGDNPWYEVVLIEGRNRELRKMFEEIGHFVEKIRRVGYGPLILDQEPGHLRELDAQELDLLRKAADGKWKTPKAKEIRRRNIVDSLSQVKPAFRPRGDRPAAGPKDYKPKRAFTADKPNRAGSEPARSGRGQTQPRTWPVKPGRGATKFGSGAERTGFDRPADIPPGRQVWRKDERAGTPGERPPVRFPARPAEEARPSSSGGYRGKPTAGRPYAVKPAGKTFAGKPSGGKPFAGKPSAGRSFPAKPAWKKPPSQEWPPYKRPPASGPEAARRPAPAPMEDLGPRKPSQLRIEPIRDTDRTRSDRTGSGRSGSGRTGTGSARTGSGRPASDRAAFGASSGRSGSARSASGRSGVGRSSSVRPFRGEGGLARPFTTSSGKPRAGGARPSSKPGTPGGSSYGGASRAGQGSGGNLRRGQSPEGLGTRGAGPEGRVR